MSPCEETPGSHEKLEPTPTLGECLTRINAKETRPFLHYFTGSVVSVNYDQGHGFILHNGKRLYFSTAKQGRYAGVVEFYDSRGLIFGKAVPAQKLQGYLQQNDEVVFQLETIAGGQHQGQKRAVTIGRKDDFIKKAVEILNNEQVNQPGIYFTMAVDSGGKNDFGITLTTRTGETPKAFDTVTNRGYTYKTDGREPGSYDRPDNYSRIIANRACLDVFMSKNIQGGKEIAIKYLENKIKGCEESIDDYNFFLANGGLFKSTRPFSGRLNGEYQYRDFSFKTRGGRLIGLDLEEIYPQEGERPYKYYKKIGDYSCEEIKKSPSLSVLVRANLFSGSECGGTRFPAVINEAAKTIEQKRDYHLHSLVELRLMLRCIQEASAKSKIEEILQNLALDIAKNGGMGSFGIGPHKFMPNPSKKATALFSPILFSPNEKINTIRFIGTQFPQSAPDPKKPWEVPGTLVRCNSQEEQGSGDIYAIALPYRKQIGEYAGLSEPLLTQWMDIYRNKPIIPNENNLRLSIQESEPVILTQEELKTEVLKLIREVNLLKLFVGDDRLKSILSELEKIRLDNTVSNAGSTQTVNKIWKEIDDFWIQIQKKYVEGLAYAYDQSKKNIKLRFFCKDYLERFVNNSGIWQAIREYHPKMQKDEIITKFLASMRKLVIEALKEGSDNIPNIDEVAINAFKN